jgi:hypothetical protein
LQKDRLFELAALPFFFCHYKCFSKLACIAFFFSLRLECIAVRIYPLYFLEYLGETFKNYLKITISLVQKYFFGAVF